MRQWRKPSPCDRQIPSAAWRCNCSATCSLSDTLINGQRCRHSADFKCGRPPSYANTALTHAEFQLKVHFYIGKHRNRSRRIRSTLFTPDMRHFDVRWPWPLTFWAENWHIDYSCPGDVYTSFGFISSFCSRVRSPCRTDRQTDGQDA